MLIIIYISINNVYTQTNTVVIKNDTLFYSYKVKLKSPKKIIVLITKKNICNDTIITYGYPVMNKRKLIHKIIINSVNSKTTTGIIDRLMFDTTLYHKGIFVDEKRLSNYYIALAPNETYSLKLILKDTNEIIPLRIYDRFKVVHNISFIEGSRWINLNNTSFSLLVESGIIIISINPTLIRAKIK